MTQLISPFVKSQENPAEGTPCRGEDCYLTQKLAPSSYRSPWPQQRRNPCVWDGWCDLLLPECKPTICWTERPCCCFVTMLQWGDSLVTLPIVVAVQLVSGSRSILSLFLHSATSSLSANPNYWNGKDIALLAIIISAWIFVLFCFVLFSSGSSV